MMATRRMSMLCLAVATILLLPVKAAAQSIVRIVQTNSAGDNVHLIDPATNTVVGEITGIERATWGRCVARRAHAVCQQRGR